MTALLRMPLPGAAAQDVSQAIAAGAVAPSFERHKEIHVVCSLTRARRPEWSSTRRSSENLSFADGSRGNRAMSDALPYCSAEGLCITIVRYGRPIGGCAAKSTRFLLMDYERLQAYFLRLSHSQHYPEYQAGPPHHWLRAIRPGMFRLSVIRFAATRLLNLEEVKAAPFPSTSPKLGRGPAIDSLGSSIALEALRNGLIIGAVTAASAVGS